MMVMIEVKDNRTNMIAFGKVVPFVMVVRNELNDSRGPGEVVYSENADGSKGVPYQPRPFPLGTWKVGFPVQKNDAYAPYFIPTDAHQLVDEWELQDGKYLQKTGKRVDDWGYGIHCELTMSFKSSWGCFVIVHQEDLDYMVNKIVDFLREPMYGGVLEIAVS